MVPTTTLGHNGRALGNLQKRTRIYTKAPRSPSICISPRLLSFPSPTCGGGDSPEEIKPEILAADHLASTSGGGSSLMEGVSNGVEAEDARKPLSEVVSDCVQRWFQDTLKEARRGDTAMQVLVAQMYHSGYGIPRNEHKGRQWMEKASRYRSSVWKVGTKRPGYNASDSDSDDANDDIEQ